MAAPGVGWTFALLEPGKSPISTFLALVVPFGFSTIALAALLSAALQHYPNRHVVLLIDDPPFPTTDDDRHKLAEARALPGRIMELLAPARRSSVLAETSATMSTASRTRSRESAV